MSLAGDLGRPSCLVDAKNNINISLVYIYYIFNIYNISPVVMKGHSQMIRGTSSKNFVLSSTC